MKLNAFAKDQFRVRLEKLSEQFEKAHKVADDEAIHDLRVAIRRFTQVLLVFRRLLPVRKVESARKKLKKIMRAAGEVRNLDVALIAIGAQAPAGLKKKLEAMREKASAKLNQRVSRALKSDWADGWHAHLKFGHSRLEVHEFADRALPKLQRAFLAEGDSAAAPDSSPVTLHQFRIATKRLRYTLELFVLLEESETEERLEVLRGLQQILGDIHDSVVNAQLIHDLKGPAAIEQKLAKRQAQFTAKFRTNWPKLRTALDKPRESVPPTARKTKK